MVPAWAGAELDVVDRALLVLEAAQRVDHRLRRLEARRRSCRRSGGAATPCAGRRDSAARCSRTGGSMAWKRAGSNLPLTPLKFGSLIDHRAWSRRRTGRGPAAGPPRQAQLPQWSAAAPGGRGRRRAPAPWSADGRTGGRSAAAGRCRSGGIRSVEISVWPTLASVDWPNPLKMSAMPQTPKLTIKTPITMAMMVLPSQFDEAFRIPRSMGPTCLQEGTGARLKRNSQKGVTGLITHHKVAVAPRNLRLLDGPN